MASLLKASSSYYYYTNQTKQHSINRRRIIIPTTQISLPRITTTTCSSIRASTFRVQCFKQQVEEKEKEKEKEKERKPNQNPFEFFFKALKKLPVYQIYSIVLLIVSRSPIVIGLLLVLDLCLLISSTTLKVIKQNGGEIVLEIGPVLGLILFFPIMSMLVYDRVCNPPQKCTVIKFQVGLLGLTPSLEEELESIRNWCGTFPDLFNSVVDRGRRIILPVIASSLVRHLDYCISVYSSVDVKRSIKDGEEHIKELCIEERGKFDEEAPVNVNNTERQRTTSKRANGLSNEYHVITILLVAKGVHKLPAINGREDLKEALQKLGSISPIDNLLAVEVLWNENGKLTERELVEDYPLLRPL